MYIGVLYFSAIWIVIDADYDQHRNQNINNKVHLVGQLTGECDACEGSKSELQMSLAELRTK